MSKRIAGYLILANIILALALPITLSTPPEDDDYWWDHSWSSRKEIVIPINTSSKEAHYQPIDVHVEFEKSCWAKNEEEHSIRVIFQEGGRFIVLDSQIYDELNFTDDEHISSCNLVFLIPKEANGNEKYYIYYNDEEKPSPNYEKRVDIVDGSYYYSPIQGLAFESDFYKITQGDQIIYAVAKRGETYEGKTSQQISKIKEGEKEIKPNSGEHVISPGFVYWWREKVGGWHGNAYSANEKLKNTEVLVNGNLMVKFGIVSQSENGKIQSTIIYKYYYCPTEDKRIYMHVKHEILDYSLPEGVEIDVTYCIFPVGKFRSSTFDELNFGEIPPYLHFYSEEERPKRVELNQNPESPQAEKVIEQEDDYDLGSIPWVSADHGESGTAHSIIFESNNVLKSGSDERDGIELSIYESKIINYPGLTVSSVWVYLCRNDFEEGEPPDGSLPEDYVVEFNAEYFTTKDGGFPAVDKEARLYQKLISFQPEEEDKIEEEEIEEEKYTITSFLDRFQCLSIDKNIADTAAEIRRKYKLKLPDAFQAAIAKLNNLILVTRNTKDFNSKMKFVKIPYKIEFPSKP